MQSQENDQKPQFGQFFDDFENCVTNQLWNTVRDFITLFNKYKTYLFYVIILSFFITILSYKEIRLSFKKNKTFSVIVMLYFKEIRLFCLIIILSFKNIKLSV